jgi:hypothetical protein
MSVLYPCTATKIVQLKMTSVPVCLTGIKVKTFSGGWRTHIMRMDVIETVSYVPENSTLV